MRGTPLPLKSTVNMKHSKYKRNFLITFIRFPNTQCVYKWVSKKHWTNYIQHIVLIISSMSLDCMMCQFVILLVTCYVTFIYCNNMYHTEEATEKSERKIIILWHIMHQNYSYQFVKFDYSQWMSFLVMAFSLSMLFTGVGLTFVKDQPSLVHVAHTVFFL